MSPSDTSSAIDPGKNFSWFRIELESQGFPATPKAPGLPERPYRGTKDAIFEYFLTGTRFSKECDSLLKKT